MSRRLDGLRHGSHSTPDPQAAQNARCAQGVAAGYKLTEVGVIPEDWETTPLGTICSMKSGASITSASIDNTARFPCHGGNGLRGFTDRFTHSGRFALIGRQGALCGNVVGVSGQFFASEHAVVVTACPQTDIGWLTYVLGGMRLNQYSESSAQPGLSVAKLLLLDVACPPTKAEQRAIAAVLTDMDALIGSLEALMAKKRAVKRAAMQKLLNGRIRLPGFGRQWKTAPLSTIVSIRDSRVSPSTLPGRTLCVELEHIGQGNGRLTRSSSSSSASERVSTKYRFEVGDILFGRLRPYLRKWWHADRAGVCSTEIWPLATDPSKADNAFVYALVQAGRLNEAANVSYGTHMPRADWGVVSEVALPLPPLAEQRAIAAVLSDMDAEIAALEGRRDKTRAVKQGMMQQLLTGSIRLPIPEVVAEDEPGR